MICELSLIGLSAITMLIAVIGMMSFLAITRYAARIYLRVLVDIPDRQKGKAAHALLMHFASTAHGFILGGGLALCATWAEGPVALWATIAGAVIFVLAGLVMMIAPQVQISLAATHKERDAGPGPAT